MMNNNVKERAEMSMKIADAAVKIARDAKKDPEDYSCRQIIHSVEFFADFYDVGVKFSTPDKIRICSDAFNLVCYSFYPGDEFTKGVYERVQREISEG